MGLRSDDAVASPPVADRAPPRAAGTEGRWRAAAGLGTLAGAIAGAALAVVLLAHYGVAAVLDLLSRAGWGILWVTLFHVSQLWVTAIAWHAVLPARRHGPGTATLLVVRWIREGLNTLLPTAQIGGIVVGIGLLARRGVTTTEATAATVVDLSMEITTQILFTLLGLAVLLATVDGRPLALPLLIGFCVVLSMALGLVAAQRFGLARFAERLAGRLGRPGRVAGLHEAVAATYRSRRAIAIAGLCHFAGWLLGAVEICLALHFLGHDVGIASGLIVESLGQMLRIASFAIPAALGVQEGGYILLCGLLGLPADLALALSLMRRLREIILGAPSIAVWLWVRRRAVAGRG